MTTAKQKRVLTGLQASGTPHLGNYFGALKPAIELGNKYDLFLFIADFHMLDLCETAELNRSRSLEMAAVMLACGLDPDKSVFYSQSMVPEVCELFWILSCQSSYGLISRAVSFKDKLAKNIEVNCGVFNYPILMTADIVLYDADLVPVGKDQKQHLEMARDIAQRFNNVYGDTFVIPEPLISEDVGLVPGTDGQKMSKSKGNVISIFATDKVWKQQVMTIVTDSTPLEAPKNPDTCNVFAIYRLLATATEVTAMREKYQAGGFGYGHAKQALLENIKATFTPLRDRYDDWMRRPDDLHDVLLAGSRKASVLATAKLERVQKVLGLLGRGRGGQTAATEDDIIRIHQLLAGKIKLKDV